VNESWSIRVPQVGAVALLPLVMIFTSVRLLLTPTFLEIEYSWAWFPADPYGFTLEDRKSLGSLSLQAVLEPNPTPILEAARLPDGTPAFDARQVGHMQDVRGLVQRILRIWLAAAAVSAAGLIWIAVRSGGLAFWETLGRGGRATLLVMAGVGALVLIAFPVFFTGFHRIFFQGDSWLFAYSDTLIRLFPLRFWQDASLAIVLLTGAQALAAIGLQALARRRAAAAAASGPELVQPQGVRQK
jgi:integral membrane protein (TIGR01906 family)